MGRLNKEGEIQAKVEGLTKAEADARCESSRLDAEKAVNEKRVADAKALVEEEAARCRSCCKSRGRSRSCC